MSQLALQTRSAQGSTSDPDASGTTSTSGPPVVAPAPASASAAAAAAAAAADAAAADAAPRLAVAPVAHHPRLPHQKHPLHRLQVADVSSHSPSSKDGPTTGLLIPASDPASISNSTTANTSIVAATAASHIPSSTTSPLLTPSPRYVPLASTGSDYQTSNGPLFALLCFALIPSAPDTQSPPRKHRRFFADEPFLPSIVIILPTRGKISCPPVANCPRYRHDANRRLPLSGRPFGRTADILPK
ncbi:hypothetical protein CORC01_05684 [Colletotrichum orchidophilum]|uniref:Uncharacterized protein n=1 Tax=Colletotrichum orchidophilum TaxID=1209926 RepID=A0A1G4BC64_9PEZI|nr:uncharacterized protein CORC01_05684 [Colletotrichum orchidophilum]OHE98994.1 hypothetical protein CORC01_05684 [Colletotrichum orchidophilum]